MVARACTSIQKQGNKIINILSEQERWIAAKKGRPPVLTPAQLVEVLTKVDGLGVELIELLNKCKSLEDLYEKSKTYGATKTEVKIDAAVHDAVLEAVSREDEDFKKEFAAVAALSDRIAKKTDFYRTDPAQVFMATWVLSHKNF